MARIGLFDIVGPIMVGPSSSHTAGAVRLGLAARKILGSEVQKAKIELHGPFLPPTGGTVQMLPSSLAFLGMPMDDERIPWALDLAQEAGLSTALLP